MFDHVMFGCYTKRSIFIYSNQRSTNTRGEETNHCTTTYKNMNQYAFWYSNLKNCIALSLSLSLACFLLFKLSFFFFLFKFCFGCFWDCD